LSEEEHTPPLGAKVTQPCLSDQAPATRAALFRCSRRRRSSPEPHIRGGQAVVKRIPGLGRRGGPREKGIVGVWAHLGRGRPTDIGVRERPSSGVMSPEPETGL